MSRGKFFVFFVFFCLWTFLVYAGTYRLDAELDRKKIDVQGQVHMRLIFQGANDVEPPSFDVPEDVTVRYVGPATRVLVVNGEMSRSITHTFLLVPQKEGEYVLGPFIAERGGEKYIADELELEVVSHSPASGMTGSSEDVESYRSSDHVSENVFLQLNVPKTEVYLNEAIDLEIRLYVKDISLYNVENPFFSHEGFMVEQIGRPHRTSEYFKGRQYRVLIFNYRIFAMREGEHVIGPARLKCNKRSADGIPGSSLFDRFFDDDFFSSSFGSKKIELRSLAVPIKILPLPKEGRPDSFQGAVGSFNMDVRLKNDSAEVGNPVILEMEVRGEGDLDTVTIPRVEPSDDFRIYDPQVKTKENAKIYEQVFIPKSVYSSKIPEVRFSFFDPDKAEYIEIVRGPFSLEVEAGERKAGDGSRFDIMRERSFPERDIIHIKPPPAIVLNSYGEIWKSFWFWMMQFIILFLVSGIGFYCRYRERVRSDAGFARKNSASKKTKTFLKKAAEDLSKNKLEDFYNDIQGVLTEYFSGKFSLSPGSADYEKISENLRKNGAGAVFIKELSEIFSVCEAARYGSMTGGTEKAEDLFRKTKRMISKLEKKGKRGIHGKIFMLTIFCMFFFSLFSHLGGTEVRASNDFFIEANRAYERSDFEGAVNFYQKVFQERRFSGELFYNLGNAHYKNRDLGEAILNYLRAGRFLPRDADLEANLRLARREANVSYTEKDFFKFGYLGRFSGRLTSGELHLMASIVFAMILILVLIFPIWYRKTWYYYGAVVLLCGLLTLSIYCIGKRSFLYRHLAIVLEDRAEAFYGPIEDTKVFFILNEGDAVVKTRSERGWVRVKKPNGEAGWIKKRVIGDLEFNLKRGYVS